MASHDSGFPKGNAHLRRARRMGGRRVKGKKGVKWSLPVCTSLYAESCFYHKIITARLPTQWWASKALRNEVICRRSYLTQDRMILSRLLLFCFAISTFKTLLAAPPSRRSLHFPSWSPRSRYLCAGLWRNWARHVESTPPRNTRTQSCWEPPPGQTICTERRFCDPVWLFIRVSFNFLNYSHWLA